MPRFTTLHRIEAHQDAVWSTSWVGSTNRLVTGSVDETVKVWEETPDQLQFVHNYQGHTLGVVSVVVNSAGEVAAASALDSTIRVWNLATNRDTAIIETASTETWSITFSPLPDQLQLATAAGTRASIVLWNVGDDTSMQAELHLPQDEKTRNKERFVLSVAYSADGQLLACGAMDGTVAVFDVATGKALHVLEGHYKPVRALTFLPGSKTLLTACDDMHINMYDVENAALIESFSGHESWVLSVSAHPSGSMFASGGSDAKVKLWDVGARACIQTVTDHTDQVWAVAFNADGSRLASAGDDKRLITYSYA